MRRRSGVGGRLLVGLGVGWGAVSLAACGDHETATSGAGPGIAEGGFAAAGGRGGVDASGGGDAGSELSGGRPGSGGGAEDAGAAAVAGSGGAAACPTGQTDCAGVCVSLPSNAAHCGACGHACDPGEVCVDGACSCAAGRTRCGEECVELTSDPAHCGGCDQACASEQVCSLGGCALDCAPGLAACDRACVDLDTDAEHCGACDAFCAAGQRCVDGACACAAGEQLCGDACTDLGVDPLNCGSCAERCRVGEACVRGVCEGAGTGGAPGTGGAGAPGGAGESGGEPGGVDGGAPAGGGPGGNAGDAPGGATGAGGAGTGGEPSGGAPPIAAVCTPSVSLYDTSGASLVGDGTPESCTESELRDLAAQGGVIAFDCGPEPVTIDLTETIELRTDVDTIIDGGGRVTLDAGGQTRHFRFESGNWMVTTTRVVLQRLVLRNGRAPAGEYFPPVDGYPECAYGYKEGSGGAVYVRDGVLEVIDCDFYDNEAALIGPDVGGGAIYALGAARVVISGSRFVGNRGANGGAVGMLFANPEIYNSLFEDNTAEGTGQNRAVSEAECPAIYAFGHENQAGAGGLAGGVYFDGANDEDRTYVICGSVFRNNRANELAGALFRTPNVGMRQMRIENSTFDGNTAVGGGVSFIKQNDLTVVGSTFMNNRSGVLVDGTDVGGWASGLWVNEGTVDLTNSTFYENSLDVDGSGSVARNVTFSGSDLNVDIALYNSLVVDTGCGPGSAGDGNVQWPSGTACAGGTTFADPALSPPGDHGGPTYTLLPANVAAVAGRGTLCPSTDQRGEPRATASCAAGAVEP